MEECKDSEEENSSASDGGRHKRCNVHVNRGYIPLKLIYFFFMAGEACALPYRSIFMKHLGLSTKQTGVIWTVERAVSIVLPPFLGAITDKSRRPKLVLITLLLTGSLLLFSMYFVPQEDYVSVQRNASITSEEMINKSISMCWTTNCTLAPGQETTICIVHSPKPWDIYCDETENLQRVTTVICHEEHFVDEDSLSRDSNGTNALNSSVEVTRPTLTPSEENVPRIQMVSTECIIHYAEVNITLAHLPSPNALNLINTVTDSGVYISDDKLCMLYEDTSAGLESKKCGDFVLNEVDEYGITFWLMFALVVLSSCATIGSYPVIESGVLEALGPKNRHRFGQQRLWASVGYGSAALTVGYFKDMSADAIGVAGAGNQPFLPMFVGVVICWFFASLVALKLPISKVFREKGKVKLKHMKHVLMKPKALAFFALIFFYGTDIAVQEIYLFWLAENKLNASTFILGASTFVGALLDIPFCLAAGPLIRKFGHTALIIFGMVVFSLRMIFCGIITEAWQLVLVESSRSITWGLTWVVVCSYTAKISPRGLETSTMGITQATLWGLGYSTGALVGGVLFEVIGGDNLFVLFGSMSMSASILFAIYSFCSRQKHDQDSTSLENGKLQDENEETDALKFEVDAVGDDAGEASSEKDTKT